MEGLKYLVAEVKVVDDIEFENGDVIEKGRVVTVSNLDHPTDLKLWYRGTFQIRPECVDWENPVKIMRGVKGNIF